MSQLNPVLVNILCSITEIILKLGLSFFFPKRDKSFILCQMCEVCSNSRTGYHISLQEKVNASINNVVFLLLLLLFLFV